MKHIYPYSEKNYILGSLNDYYYHSYMARNDISLLSSYDLLFYKLKLFNRINKFDYKLLFFYKCRKILLLESASFLIYFTDNINIKYNSNCYITPNIINIKDKKYNTLSSSDIPIRYLFNFADKNFLFDLKYLI